MLILASASPRRRELLTQAGFSFEIRPSAIDERPRTGEDGVTLATRLAREKAESVFVELAAPSEIAATLEPPVAAGDRREPLLVLGADTVVVCGEEILGKPADAADAARMLRLLSGRTHQVITGLSLVSGGKLRPEAEVASEITEVTMRTLSESEILDYVACGEPMDKAGAYAIQGRAGRWIPCIHGCYFNVVGLPLARVSSMIEAAYERCQGSATWR